MSLNVFLFYVVAGLTGLSAISMVVTQNIVRAAAWLLFTLAGVSGIFFLLGGFFVGAAQLLVYVGGTLVLVVFGVMLTAQGPFITMKTGAAEWAISTVVGLLLFGTLAVSIVTAPKATPELGYRVPGHKEGQEMTSSTQLGASLLGDEKATPPGELTGYKSKQGYPRRNRSAYLLPFEIVSVHLLVVLVGAAYLARTKRRRGAPA